MPSWRIYAHHIHAHHAAPPAPHPSSPPPAGDGDLEIRHDFRPRRPPSASGSLDRNDRSRHRSPTPAYATSFALQREAASLGRGSERISKSPNPRGGVGRRSRRPNLKAETDLEIAPAVPTVRNPKAAHRREGRVRFRNRRIAPKAETIRRWGSPAREEPIDVRTVRTRSIRTHRSALRFPGARRRRRSRSGRSRRRGRAARQ